MEGLTCLKMRCPHVGCLAVVGLYMINMLASEEDKALLKEWVVKEKFNPQEKIKEVTEIYNRSGVKEVLRAKVDDYLEKSRIALDKIEVPEERKVRFYEMIDFIGKRKK